MAPQPVSTLPHALSKMAKNNPVLVFMILSAGLITLGAIVLVFSLVKKDYQAAVARGTGGTPSSFFGYLELNFFRLFQVRDPRTALEVSPQLYMQRGFLERLPVRQGLRPRIVGLAPQRQITQIGPKPMYEALAGIIIDFERSHQAQCYLGRSTYKNNNTALFARTTGYSRTKYHGEICHAHPNDGSMHLNMHPADIKIVVEAGWGERHPLARENWLWNLVCPVPAGLTLVYSPREEKELEVMKDVVKAAAWWLSGVDSKSIEDSWS
jgi:hypothetical protein